MIIIKLVATEETAPVEEVAATEDSGEETQEGEESVQEPKKGRGRPRKA